MSKATHEPTTVPRCGLSVGPERGRLIRGRLEEICAALRIPRPAVDGAMSSDAKMIAFAAATGQSLDWIVLGDMSSMIRCRYAQLVGATDAAA